MYLETNRNRGPMAGAFLGQRVHGAGGSWAQRCSWARVLPALSSLALNCQEERSGSEERIGMVGRGHSDPGGADKPKGSGDGIQGELGAVVWMEGDGDQQWSGSRYVLKVELKGVSDKLWYTGKDRGFSMHLKVFGQSKWKEAMD